ncbi:MAG: formyltransferase family protein [Rhodospirillales bacterium]
MMIDNVVLLTGQTEGPYLAETLRFRHDGLNVLVVHDAVSLANAVAELLDAHRLFRLIAFSTDIIVPAEIIETLPTVGYNFHAGPPEHPGSLPACFAVYEGADVFGVTVHELAKEVDCGAIVAVRRFPIPDDLTATDLMGRAYQVLAGLFSDMVKDMVDQSDPLPVIGEKWCMPVRRRIDAAALVDTPDGMEAGEAERRRRAFGHLAR